MSRERESEHGGHVSARFEKKRNFGEKKRSERKKEEMSDNGKKNRIENGIGAVETRKFISELFRKSSKDSFEILEDYLGWLQKARVAYLEYKHSKSGGKKLNSDREDELRRLIVDDTDLEYEFTLSSGPGGQNVQKNETATKVMHTKTGIFAEKSDRSQFANRKEARNVLWNRVLEHLSKVEKSIDPGLSFENEIERIFCKAVGVDYQSLVGSQKGEFDSAWESVFGVKPEIKSQTL